MILADLIKKSVSEYSNEIFIIERGLYRRKEFTYQDIYERATALCGLFFKKGIKKGDKIIIYLPNSADYASLLWACALSGVVAVPIDFNSNEDFVDIIYERVNAKINFCSLLRFKSKHNNYFVEELSKVYSDSERYKVKEEIKENDIYEIVYTSGTTSLPKGVIITNKNLVSNIKSMKELVDFRLCNVNLLSLLPLSHMFEQNIGFFLVMNYGAKIIYLYSRKSNSIIETIEKENIKLIVSVPLFLGLIKERIEDIAKEESKLNSLDSHIDKYKNYPLWFRKIIFYNVRKRLRNLEYIIVGGAPLDLEIEEFLGGLGFKILQGYGLTESSPVLACNNLNYHKTGTVGKPLSKVQIKIINGEIIAKGENIFSGYYEDNEATKEVLRDNWLYTGDIGEFDSNGFLKITGRKKNIILSPSGKKVYPEDVEKVLNSFKSIKDSVVVGLDNGKKIVGFVLSDRNVDLDDLLKEANLKLSEYQYLNKIYRWPDKDFPRNSARKVIRINILKRFESLTKNDKLIRAPDKDILVNIVSEICEVDSQKIKNTSVLVNLGLDSLRRINLAIKIEENFDIDFDEDGITEKTTIDDIRRLILESREIKNKSGINVLNSNKFIPIRIILQTIINLISRIFYSIKIEGLENIPNKQVIFIANHQSMLDTQAIFRTLPISNRIRLHPAGAADTFFEGYKKVFGALARLSYNVFSFSRDKHIKQSLKDFGKIIDSGGDVLIYPEGTRSNSDKMVKFKSGIGLLSWHMDIPVIPIKLIGLYDVLPKGKIRPRFGKKIRVIIGKPIEIDKTKSVYDITKNLQNSLERLK